MIQEEINRIVERHQHWIKKDCDGWEHMQANFTQADLRNADFSNTDLRNAYFMGANLSDANFSNANLRNAILCHADLSDADFSNADLHGVDFHSADLRRVDLSSAKLSGAGFNCANLFDVTFRDVNQKKRLGRILTEPLTGYMKTREGVVITAEIPIGAIVFCINCKLCRTNRAKIIDMKGNEVLHPEWSSDLECHLGQEIIIEDFNLMYNVEYANGFHFYESRKAAEKHI